MLRKAQCSVRAPDLFSHPGKLLTSECSIDSTCEDMEIDRISVFEGSQLSTEDVESKKGLILPILSKMVL